MKKYWYLFATGTLVFVLAILWWFLRYKAPQLPQLAIPGLVKIEQVENDYTHIKTIATVKYLGVTYDCSLTINIDANGEFVLPAKNQSLTPIVSSDENLEIWKDQIKLGSLPIVLVVDAKSDNIYLIGPKGGSLKPVVVKPGIVNFVTFDKDTILRGQEGVKVRVFRANRQSDEGELPFATKLGNDQGTVEIKDVQVFGIGGVGIFNIYTGKTQIKRGNNNILPVGRFVGNYAWFDKGLYLGSSDVGYCANGDIINILANDMKEVTLDGLDPKMIMGNGCLPDGSLVVYANGKFINLHKNGATTDINFQSSTPVAVSGDYILSGKKNFDTSSGKAFIAGIDFDYIAYDTAIINTKNELQAYHLGPDGPKKIWTKRCQIDKNSKLVKASKGIVFFDMGNFCSEYLDIGTGASGTNLHNLVIKEELGTFKGNGLCFPNGNRIEQGIVCLSENGRIQWSRKGEKPSRIGAFAVAVEDKNGRKTIYDIGTGEEIASWTRTNMNITSLDEFYFAMTVNDTHTIFVQRLTKTKQ